MPADWLMPPRQEKIFPARRLIRNAVCFRRGVTLLLPEPPLPRIPHNSKVNGTLCGNAILRTMSQTRFSAPQA